MTTLTPQSIPIRDVMEPAPAALEMTATVEAASAQMAERGCSWLAVRGRSGIVGVLAGGDIVRRLVSRGGSAAETNVAEIMTVGMIHCHPDDTLGDALEIIRRHRIRRIGVLDKRRRLVGVVAAPDLLRKLTSSASQGKGRSPGRTSQRPDHADLSLRRRRVLRRGLQP